MDKSKILFPKTIFTNNLLTGENVKHDTRKLADLENIFMNKQAYKSLDFFACFWLGAILQNSLFATDLLVILRGDLRGSE